MAKKRNYVEKQDLHYELEQYAKSDVISDDLHEMFMVMSQKISLKIQYKDKPYRDDMIGAAHEKCISRAHKYDLSKDNPFAYFQSVIENMFKDYIAKVNKERSYHTKLSNEMHNNIARQYNLRIENEEIEVSHSYDETPKTLLYWKKSFLDFMFIDSKTDDEYIPIPEQIKQHFEVNSIEAQELLQSGDAEIIYINDICDNILGHCICDKCKNLQFKNIIGSALMNHRQVLNDIKGHDEKL